PGAGLEEVGMGRELRALHLRLLGGDDLLRVGAGARAGAAARVDADQGAADGDAARVDADEAARALDGQILRGLEDEGRPRLEVDLLARLERVVLHDLLVMVLVDR